MEKRKEKLNQEFIISVSILLYVSITAICICVPEYFHILIFFILFLVEVILYIYYRYCNIIIYTCAKIL